MSSADQEPQPTPCSSTESATCPEQLDPCEPSCEKEESRDEPSVRIAQSDEVPSPLLEETPEEDDEDEDEEDSSRSSDEEDDTRAQTWERIRTVAWVTAPIVAWYAFTLTDRWIASTWYNRTSLFY